MIPQTVDNVEKNALLLRNAATGLVSQALVQLIVMESTSI